ncbi:CoA-acylating methylmalonate-semialdehyde dehydrogenase [Sulfuriferula sp. GW1]|uniref:CoA-acylating methylmalonate-semialdehyde dehydrogenase n=1 Tax=Sulfuriferula sp. GW1 TaxID=3345111 RepID=UPI0039B08BE6
MPNSILPLWINGQRTESRSSRRAGVTNPATGAVIRQVPLASRDDVTNAIEAAKAAFPAWRETTPLRRSRILNKFRELLETHRAELAQLASEEHGKTLEDATGSVQRGIEVVEFAVGAPHLLKGEHAENVGRGVDCHSMLQPIGVCAGITPFNFPAMVPMWMFPLAIACGNTFVLKPSEKVPSCSLRMAELFKEAGLPDGVFNVVPGDKEAVDTLLSHPDVRAISFVGSTPVAKYIYETAAHHGKRVQALGGAKNHAVVLPDAALDFTADAIMGAAYGSAGERCMAISTVVAVGNIADALVARLKEKAEKLVVGPGDRKGVDMGPVISAQHRDKIVGLIDSGVAQGATLVTDGRGIHVPGFENGYFVGPTLFDHVSTEMDIYREEIFGPVLIVLRVASYDEAIKLVNSNPYANGTAIFTSSGAAARRFQHEIEVGMVGINVPIPVPMAFFSFGGWKSSLFGDLHMHGMEGVYFYTRTKAITSRWPEQSDLSASTLVMPTLG